jgi:hypothetical protein
MLLFVSPEGFVPYGGRSASFHFRGAIVAALCELEARRYRESDPRLAGAFKRQARLSAQTMTRWMEMEPWRHIENGFGPAERHGIDNYGNYSVYSLLIASFLGLAALFADDSIAEAPAPAESGGFAVAFAPEFHKTIANCGGSYVEIDTAADLHYDATGLGRFCVRGVPLELGLAMPLAPQPAAGEAPHFLIAPSCRRPAEAMALGPEWFSGGEWIALARCSSGLKHGLTIHKETRDAVEFEIRYEFGSAEILEKYLLQSGRLSIRSSVSIGGKPARMRMVIPLLETDGQERSRVVGPADGVASVHYRGQELRVAFDAGLQSQLAAEGYANRNGVYRALLLEPSGGEVTVQLALK